MLAGNFSFDFDCEDMRRILHVPSEEFRDKVRRSPQEYMTTIRKELREIPDRERIKAFYRRACERTLRGTIFDGELLPDEVSAIEAAERKLASEDLLRMPGGLRQPGVKIHQDVWVRESKWKSDEGTVHLSARVRHGRIEEVAITGERAGDGFDLPALAEALRGIQLRRDAVAEALETCWRNGAGLSPGARGVDWVSAVMGLGDTGHEASDG